MGMKATLAEPWRRSRGMRCGICVVVPIALFLTCARIGTAHAKAPPNFFGISDPFEVAPHAKHVRRMASGGVGWAHTGFVWSQLEPSLGHFNWDRSDNIIGNLASRGIHVFPYVLGSPGYAAKAPNRPPLRSKRARKAWKGFLRALVNRYGRGGDYWRGYRVQHPGGQNLNSLINNYIGVQNLVFTFDIHIISNQ